VRFFNSRRATINALAGYVALALCASLRTGHFEKAVFVSALAASLFAFMQKPQAKA
jgi:menaquinone-dependent protoporphyrinogen IX oxidase